MAIRSRRRRRSATLRGRVSLIGTLVIAGWLVVLVIGLDLILSDRLQAQADESVRARAEAVATTVVQQSDGTVTVTESDNDALLDVGIWVYAGGTLVEQPSGVGQVQSTADRVAGSPDTYATANSLRFYSTPVTRDRKVVAVVVASIRLTAYQHAAKITRIATVLFALLVLAAAYVVLRLAAARALQPVESMAAQAAAWASHPRADRFGHQHDYAELNTLGGNLDALLDRLAAVVRHERQLAAELSHELRTPLSRIVSGSELLLAGSGNEHDLAAIRDAALSMSSILETLLSTARLEQGTLPGTCDVGALVADIDLPLAQVVVADDVHDICVYSSVAERILAPILDNARRFALSRITIEVTRVDEAVAIDVHSDGPNVPAGIRERVFEPGFRADLGDQPHDGVGLGLPLARRLARAADGDVMILPTLMGTTVRVKLPLA